MTRMWDHLPTAASPRRTATATEAGSPRIKTLKTIRAKISQARGNREALAADIIAALAEVGYCITPDDTAPGSRDAGTNL
jgi:hypothetical protein